MDNKEYYLYINGQCVPVSADVYHAYWHYTEKEKYFMNKLKKENFLCDQEQGIAKFIPSREDSLDRLLELDTQFPDTSSEMPDDAMDKSETLRNLSSGLATLSDEELVLIQELFYQARTEREVSRSLHIALSTLHERKKRVLKKLRTALEKNF